jgi:hypothetical protein
MMKCIVVKYISNEARRVMGDDKAGVSVVGIVAIAALLAGGCGSHPGAGTIDMAAMKEAAAKHGIPEAKTNPNPNSKAGPRVPGPLPTKALPKGGR